MGRSTASFSQPQSARSIIGANKPSIASGKRQSNMMGRVRGQLRRSTKGSLATTQNDQPPKGVPVVSGKRLVEDVQGSRLGVLCRTLLEVSFQTTDSRSSHSIPVSMDKNDTTGCCFALSQMPRVGS